MSQSLYLATNENATGKRMVALGMMELATRRFKRVGFFRPIVRLSPDRDQSIRLMRARYGLDSSSDAMAGVTRAEARRLLAADRYDQLIKQVQQRFKQLEQSVDLVIVEGTSFQGLVPEIEFELNADLAINLGCAVMAVYSASRKSLQDCVESVRIGNDALVDRGANVLGTVINQVPHDDVGPLEARQREERFTVSGKLFLLPEESLLRQPTLREIQEGLSAGWYCGDKALLDREVAVQKVAAMLLPDFLERLSAASLVLTPGDRSDILAGCALACLDPEGRSPAGVVLTCGLQPPPSIQRLLDQAVGMPVMTTDVDTFTAANQVAKVRAEIGEHAPRKIESALGLFERHLDHDALADLLQAPRAAPVTPMLFEYSLIERARQQRVRIALPEGTEPRILQAVDVIRRRDIADVVLLGDPSKIHAAAARVGVRLPADGVQVINPYDTPLHEEFAQAYFELRKHRGVTLDVARDRMQEVTYFGTMLVHRGLAGGLVSGAVHTTANTIRPAFEFIKTQQGVEVVSSVFLMCLKHSVLVYGDCAVIPNPTAAQLAEIGSSSADTAARFGVEPRVAMLSYSTGESGHGEDVERVREATRLLRQRRPELPIVGPVQYDAAIDPMVAATKLPDSEVAGRATVFVFPDLNTGNNTYKAVQRSAGAVAIGPVLQGLRKPVNDLSRGCTVADIVNTVAITAIQAQT